MDIDQEWVAQQAKEFQEQEKSRQKAQEEEERLQALYKLRAPQLIKEVKQLLSDYCLALNAKVGGEMLRIEDGNQSTSVKLSGLSPAEIQVFFTGDSVSWRTPPPPGGSARSYEYKPLIEGSDVVLTETSNYASRDAAGVAKQIISQLKNWTTPE